MQFESHFGAENLRGKVIGTNGKSDPLKDFWYTMSGFRVVFDIIWLDEVFMEVQGDFGWSG